MWCEFLSYITTKNEPIFYCLKGKLKKILVLIQAKFLLSVS